MNDQERDDRIKEARIFYTIAPLVGPILDKWKTNVISRMRLAQQAGEREHTALVAELSAYMNIEDEVRRKEQTYNALLEKQNGRE